MIAGERYGGISPRGEPESKRERTVRMSEVQQAAKNVVDGAGSGCREKFIPFTCLGVCLFESLEKLDSSPSAAFIRLKRADC